MHVGRKHVQYKTMSGEVSMMHMLVIWKEKWSAVAGARNGFPIAALRIPKVIIPRRNKEVCVIKI